MVTDAVPVSVGEDAESNDSLAIVGKPVSRTDLVVDAIRRAILNGSMAPGETLSERDVAARLGVSKTPVRDALKLLLLTGLVEISPFQRMMVRRVDEALITELYETRRLLEPVAVGLSVQRHPVARFAEARQALGESTVAFAAADMVGVSLANRRFHRGLYQRCENRFLVQHLDQLQDLTALSATLGWPRSTSAREADEHRAILEAYEDGARERVVELVDQHIANAHAMLVSTVFG